VVGAVLVRGGEPIGEGFHAELGGPHAEVAALEDCRARGEDPGDATLYVTLEPCAHHGRQPPCTDAIVAAGVRRVVIGADDPSDRASGRGPGILRDDGIEVTFAEGADAAAARLQNQAFRKHARTGRPLVRFKSAVTLDGRVASAAGDSRWISGSSSRELVHRWRAEVNAIAVGIGTVIADDPLLTSRPAESSAAASGSAGFTVRRQPSRVIFDSAARLPLDSALVGSISDAALLVVATPGAPPERVEGLTGAGAEVILVDGARTERVRTALAELGRREITSLMLEGGPTLAGAFLEAGEVDELRLFFAPRILGGGRPLIEGVGAERIADAQQALSTEWERIGDDLLVRARLREW
jgi:diaminohydroxyphosphoribosylaminopyrimidine deaminase/5-amino-6-(5-phosphoribosylamino)uracil reductase